ncbi:hypothetical protein D3C85_844640 [compost metagenome]
MTPRRPASLMTRFQGYKWTVSTSRGDICGSTRENPSRAPLLLLYAAKCFAVAAT